MRKIIKIFIFILSIGFLCSCETKEYKLIELTANDLATIIENNNDILFAISNSNLDNYEKFEQDLSRTAKEIRSNIYYIDISKATFWDDETIYIYTNLDTRQLSYYARVGGSLTVANKYRTQRDIYENLKDYKSIEVSIPTSDEKKKESLEKAKEEYEKGRIAYSFQYLSNAWTLKEAKDYFKSHKYYYLISNWESREIKKNKFHYLNMVMYNLSNSIYYYEFEGNIDDFKDPPQASSYSMLYYYVKDDIIYVNSEESEQDKDYKKKYEIKSIDKDNLILKEKNKEYKLTRKK